MGGCLGVCDSCTLCCYDNFFAPRPVALDSLSIHTGDLLLCRADPDGRTNGINTLGSSPWDHSGIFYVHEGQVYVIDSGSFRYGPFCRRPLDFDGSESSPEWNSIGSGPQMYLLSDLHVWQQENRLKKSEDVKGWYYERMCIRPLQEPLSDEQTEKYHEMLRELRDRPYEKDFDEMTAAAIDLCDLCCPCFRNEEANLSSLFCSELTAESYQRMGLMSDKLPSNEYVPPDFSRDHGCSLWSLCGCCWCSWILGRCCGIGELRFDGHRLFENEIQIETPIPPVSESDADEQQEGDGDAGEES